MPGTKVSPQLARELRSVVSPLRKKKETILFHPGRPCRGAFMIRHGQVRLTLDVASGLYPNHVLGSGAVIGLPATFSGEAYSLTAEVVNDCRPDFIPRRRLLDLLRQNTEAGFQIVRLLSEEIFRMRTAAKTRRSADQSLKPRV